MTDLEDLERDSRRDTEDSSNNSEESISDRAADITHSDAQDLEANHAGFHSSGEVTGDSGYRLHKDREQSFAFRAADIEAWIEAPVDSPSPQF